MTARTASRFYLGTHMPSWLGAFDVPLFISARRLRPRVQLPYAVGPWALDSGGFTELQQYGSWDHGPTPAEYAAEVRRYQRRIGHLEWAAPQDWMCEPLVINGGTACGQRFAGTGLTVAEHQARTVDNYLELTAIAPDLPWIPVVQGWQVDDYLRCVERYQRAGVDLAALPLVGVGSVCRRQATTEAADIFSALHDAGVRRLHGCGARCATTAPTSGPTLSHSTPLSARAGLAACHSTGRHSCTAPASRSTRPRLTASRHASGPTGRATCSTPSQTRTSRTATRTAVRRTDAGPVFPWPRR